MSFKQGLNNLRDKIFPMEIANLSLATSQLDINDFRARIKPNVEIYRRAYAARTRTLFSVLGTPYTSKASLITNDSFDTLTAIVEVVLYKPIVSIRVSENLINFMEIVDPNAINELHRITWTVTRNDLIVAPNSLLNHEFAIAGRSRSDGMHLPMCFRTSYLPTIHVLPRNEAFELTSELLPKLLYRSDLGNDEFLIDSN